MAEENKFQTLEDQLKESQIQQEIKKAKDWTYQWEYDLTKAKGESGGMTDIFKQQESFNQSIMKVIEGMGGGATPTYVTAQAPQQQEQPKSTNWLFVGIGIFVVYLFFFRKKR